MVFITALRDFADGLSRGLSLYMTERHDFTECAVSPRIPRLPLRQNNR